MVPEKIMKEKIDSVNKIEKQRYPQRGSYFVGLFSNYRLIIKNCLKETRKINTRKIYHFLAFICTFLILMKAGEEIH
jgi:hypothetical protein